MNETLIIEAENNGDMSVGIPALRSKITIEANVNMGDVIRDLNYKDNRKLFIEDIKNLLLWIDDMPCDCFKIEQKKSNKKEG